MGSFSGPGFESRQLHVINDVNACKITTYKHFFVVAQNCCHGIAFSSSLLSSIPFFHLLDSRILHFWVADFVTEIFESPYGKIVSEFYKALQDLFAIVDAGEFQ